MMQWDSLEWCPQGSGGKETSSQEGSDTNDQLGKEAPWPRLGKGPLS